MILHELNKSLSGQRCKTVKCTMARTLIIFALVLYFMSTYGLEINNIEPEAEDDRALVLPVFVLNNLSGLGNLGNLLGINVNLTQFLTFLFLAGSALLPLLLLFGLGAGLISAFGNILDLGYGQDAYTAYDTYSSYKRAFGLDGVDWEKLSILDWISISEETFSKFHANDLDCQKRLICEIHQNETKFGELAKKFINIFGYLRYAEVLKIPDELRYLIQEYKDAADRGRSLKKDCGDIFDCEFSVKNMVEKYTSRNNLI